MKDPLRTSAGTSWRALASSGLALIGIAAAACDGSSAGPRNLTAPIELDAYVTVEEMGGPPAGLFTDY